MAINTRGTGAMVSLKGIQTFQSGEKYIGAWSEGKYEGFGTLKALNGVIISQGTWLANKISVSPSPTIAQADDEQRLQNERKSAQIEAERIRVAKELGNSKPLVPNDHLAQAWATMVAPHFSQY